ncbi:extracellular catalytic domain type 1 short-chain-length polyhydroxyalkanoate depolymerase [Haloarchaeobius baliensis]|uniref:extracellular catalytic domain type 1 short-chain-length polyhydroxyalkanoate depolymerase n=1 Tax=Haloarchaeobius baliensis TaxID=1670458 RepID=UPI003F884385
MRRRDVLRAAGTALTATGGLAATGAAAATGTGTATTADGSYTDEYLNGAHYTRYVPSGASGGEPLLVMLHGCSQEPDEFAAATGMNALAEQEGFVVVYPDQASLANAFDCWNWYYDYNTARGSGEGAVITSIAGHEVDALGLDADSLYVAGFSAGAAMVSNLLVAYPDVYAAGGVHSGLEYDAAETGTGATWAMTYGGPDPEYQGEDAYEAMVDNGVVGTVPTVVVHGTDDYTVDPVNGEQAALQAIHTSDLARDGDDDGGVDTTPDETTTGSTGGYDWERNRFHDPDGATVVEHWAVEDMGHDWAGGAAGESYTAPDAPDASAAVWSFCSNW